MQNTERQKFEEEWKSAFDGAETTPPDRLWDSIDLKLTGEESATMKKRVVFYQRLAAATVLFALLSGVYVFYPRGEEKTKELAKTEIKKEAVTKEAATKAKATKTEEPVLTENRQKEIKKETVAHKAVAADNRVAMSNITVNEQQAESPNEQEPVAEQVEITEQPVAEEKKPGDNTFAVTSPLLQPTDQPEEIVEPRKKSRETNLWLSLGASAGNYTPNTPSAANYSLQSSYAGPSMAYLDQSKKAEPKVGTAYSFGMAVGKKFGRVVVQTGVNLGRQQIEYSSNYDLQTSSNTTKVALSDYFAAPEYVSNNDVGYTAPYMVNSTMEIISIPVQIGYMIIDRRLGWQFNTGVSPDFFLRNVLTDESGQRERFTQSAGGASPYRSVNWSGLLNTELSYRIGQHYRLSLVPGVRYSFNSILKEPTSNGRPVIVDVGFRFRYLFD